MTETDIATNTNTCIDLIYIIGLVFVACVIIIKDKQQ